MATTLMMEAVIESRRGIASLVANGPAMKATLFLPWPS